MAEEFLFETGAGHSDCPKCGAYVSESNEDYVTPIGEVRRRTAWDCPKCGTITKDESYAVWDDDDRKFVWVAFLKAGEAGFLPVGVSAPTNVPV